MSFIFCADSNKIVRKNIYQEEGLYCFKAGEIFEPEPFNDCNKLLRTIESNSVQDLNSLMGEFSILIENDEKVYVINDEIGVIKWYYYNDNNMFILSNNFWEIVKIIQPAVDDIDKNVMYDYTMLSYAFDGKTFIKGIKHIEAGSILEFDKQKFSLNIKKYKDIVYEEKINDNKEEIFDEIDKLFRKTVSKIRKFNNNPKIGITISGGLDSRFPLPYLKKSEVSISYLIGIINKKILKPLDYINAKKMADMFRLKFKVINPFSLNIEEKIKIDILRNPTLNSDILKAINYNKSFLENEKFDVLITGAYGGLIGGRVLNEELLKSNNDDFIYHMFNSYCYYRSLYTKKTIYEIIINRINRILIKLFDINFIKPQNNRYSVEQFLKNNFLYSSIHKQNTFNEFKNNFVNENKKNKNRLSIIMKYHLAIHSIEGAFESLHGQVKAYSIYSPYIYNFSKRWPSNYLKGRDIMEDFLIYKYHTLAKIGLQNNDIPLADKYNKIGLFAKIILKMKYVFIYKLRKLTINYHDWWNNKELRVYIKNRMNNKYNFFYEIFNKEDVEELIYSKKHSHLTEMLFKAKIMVDLIESKEYMNLVDEFDISSKY